MTQEQIEQIERLERVTEKIAELLDVAFGDFTPMCGSAFNGASHSSCRLCKNFQQCKRSDNLVKINAELQGPVMRDVIDWQNWR